MKFKSKFTNLDEILKLHEKKKNEPFSYMFWNLLFIRISSEDLLGTMSEKVMFMEDNGMS